MKHRWLLLSVLWLGASSAALGQNNPGTFTLTGSMTTDRDLNTATLLNSGMVLIAGGLNSSGLKLSSAELYNPATGTFTLTGSLKTAHSAHTATLLNNGMVLIAGGFNSSGDVSASAELYNPATGTFTPTGNLNTARQRSKATLLNNGTVLITGGFNSSEIVVASAELYNPATGTFTPTGNMTAARYDHTVTALNNGMVLIAGGENSSGFILASAELYNPATGTFTLTGSLNANRCDATASLLNNGTVLIAGGTNSSVNDLASAELYNPATGTFTLTGNLNTARYGSNATLLNTGMVLITGGENTDDTDLASAELYDPATGTFTLTGSLNTARSDATASLLNNGTVLIAGGDSSSGFLASAELYHPNALAFLRFPLRGTTTTTNVGLNPYTAPIVSVFDHAMKVFPDGVFIYRCDGTVAAYTTELGQSATTPPMRCGPTPYRNRLGTAFSINGHYEGTRSGADSGPTFLNYEGHPGYDYTAACTLNRLTGNCMLGTGTNVYAAAAGTIHYPESMVGLGFREAPLYHVIELTPLSEPQFLVYYLHLSTYGGARNPTSPITVTDPSPALGCPAVVTLPLAEGSSVGAGCLIAQSGNSQPLAAGAENHLGPHLHFEVQRILPQASFPTSTNCTINNLPMACIPVDPYGWNGSCEPDPYLTGVNNVPLWAFPPYLSSTSLCFGDVLTGTQASLQITLTNVANTPLTISTRQVLGANASDFTETDSCETSISPDTSCIITVSFTAHVLGAETGTLVLGGADGGAFSTVTFTVGLGGAGT